MRRRVPTDDTGPRTCTKCDAIIDGANAATKQGVDLCETHATPDNIEWALDNARHKSGIECEVCHKPLLPREADSRDPDLCENHDHDDLAAKRDHMEQARRTDIIGVGASREELV